MSEILHHELTEAVIKCAFEVYNYLGSGFLEKVYENALCTEMATQGVALQSQAIIKVHYKGVIVGDYVADLIAENKVLVELKAVDHLIDINGLQLKNYLKATGIEVGLLLNFGKSLEIRRKYVPSRI
ncbi:MAG: GxxExxY protein [Desulfuromonadaceae bacterium]